MAALFSSLQTSAEESAEPDSTSEAGTDTSDNDDDDDEDTASAAQEAGAEIVDDAYVNLRLSRRPRKANRVERGPRSISAILDPRLYEDMPDLEATPPPDPAVFPELTRAVQQEMSNLERQRQEERQRHEEALARAVAAAEKGEEIAVDIDNDSSSGSEEEDNGEDYMPLTRARVQSMTQAAHIGILRAKKEAAGKGKEATPRTIVIYNPVSGSGQGERVAKECLVPILRLARIDYTLHATKYAGHATEMVKAADIAALDGVVVCGGDGMVSEILTGLLQHGREAVARVKIGIIPTGTANAIANVLDGGVSKKPSDLIHRAALAVAAGHSRQLDVLEVVQKPLDATPMATGAAASSGSMLKPVTEEKTHYGMVRLALHVWWRCGWCLAGLCVCFLRAAVFPTRRALALMALALAIGRRALPGRPRFALAALSGRCCLRASWLVGSFFSFLSFFFFFSFGALT